MALAAPLVLISVLIALIAVWKLASVRAGVLGPTLLHVETDRPQVALTLDDGPTSAYTNAVLDLLDAADARATFFVTGAELSERPDLGRAILDRGHQLGNHSWSHPRLIFASQAALRDEIERTDAAIRALGVEGDIPFRPPYGKRLLGLHAVLGDRPAVMWDIEPESYDELSHDPDILAAHVIDRARPGSIVLLHVMYESRETTRLALPRILEGLRQKGLQVVTLAELQHP
ncbi:MAG: polysaccharide deacetylase family protein [Alphaproteobacteria bacterium]|nr:polysaccharide deacetylase family protein [Alphaproteobacteria bacterium]